MIETPALELARRIAERYGQLPQVEAVALAGSQTTSTDELSDIDLYVYYSSEIPRDQRTKIAKENAFQSEPLNEFWESGDEWIDDNNRIHIDVIFRHVRWIEEQLERVLKYHQASVGYSTAIWYNVLNSKALFDRNEWFTAQQAYADLPYPTPLRDAIIAKNHPLLRAALSSYTHQLELAIKRGDLVSINHRTAALLASYFDILFAVNRLPHPGEKRLVDFALKRCDKRPALMREQINALIAAIPHADATTLECAKNLIDELDEMLRDQGLLG